MFSMKPFSLGGGQVGFLMIPPPTPAEQAADQPLDAETADPTAKKQALAQIDAQKLRRGRSSLRQDLASVIGSALGSGISIPQ